MVRRGFWAGLLALAWIGAAAGGSAAGQDAPPPAAPSPAAPGPAAPGPGAPGPADAGPADPSAAPSPASDAPVPASPAPTSSDPEGAVVRRELRSVEESVTELKERVFRSKATLELLKELLVDTTRGGARVVVEHANHLGGAYTMESAEYYVDGKSVFGRTDTTGALDTEREFEVASLPLAPGQHNLQVNLVLRGKGYQIFSYLRSYQFRLTSTYPFALEPNRATAIRVITESRGGLRRFEERPTIVYQERTREEEESAKP